MSSNTAGLDFKDNLLAEHLTREQLADGLGISVRTLDRWHALRIGPPRIKAHRLILYRRQAVLDWLADQESHAASG